MTLCCTPDTRCSGKPWTPQWSPWSLRIAGVMLTMCLFPSPCPANETECLPGVRLEPGLPLHILSYSSNPEEKKKAVGCGESQWHPWLTLQVSGRDRIWLSLLEFKYSPKAYPRSKTGPATAVSHRAELAVQSGSQNWRQELGSYGWPGESEQGLHRLRRKKHWFGKWSETVQKGIGW